MKKALFFLFFTILFGCTSKKKELPADLLTHDDMVKVLVEVHILEAKVKKLYLNADSSSKVYHHYEKMLFDDLDIDKTAYEKSVAYYVDEISTYKDIYEEVVDSLLARQKVEKAR
ncbi:MAG: DUF4296 domain-containing protein [Cyclobacteriaceae bacterium]